MSDPIDSIFSFRNLKKVFSTSEEAQTKHIRTPSSSSSSVFRSGRDRTIDRFGHQVNQFNSTLKTVKDISDLPEVLRSASDLVGLALTLKVKNKHADDWSPLLQILKRHKAAWANDCSKLEEDNMFKRDNKLDNTPSDDKPKSFSDRINEIKAALKSYTERLQEVERILRTSITQSEIKAVATNLEAAVQNYALALHTAIEIEVEILQQNLSKVYVDRSDEEMIMQRSARDTTVEGDQHFGLFLEGTRGKALNDIQKWLEQGFEQMYCLLDVAGAGKSTFTKHIEEEWRQNRDLLIARFFFSRNKEETRTTDLFCSTVSNHFASRSDLFAEHLEKSKRANRDAGRSIGEQFRVQILEPFERLYPRPRLREIEEGPSAILIIDALDECDNSNGGRDLFLTVLWDALSTLPKLRIFATGRPLTDIKNVLHGPNIRVTHFRETGSSNDDVTFYVNQRLSKDTVNPFSEDMKRQIASLAAGHFIWARVACDLLVKAFDRDRLLRQFQEGTNEDDDRLNHLYRIAMRESVPTGESKQAVSLVLQVLFAAQQPLSIEDLEHFSPQPRLVQRVITALGSLLIFEGRSGPVRPLHLTFREFITNRTTSGDYFIPLQLGHRILASKCIEVLYNEPRYDMLLSKNSVTISISVWEYSSSYWAYHSEMCYGKLSINSLILNFTEQGLVSWMGDWSQGLSKRVRRVVPLALKNLVMCRFWSQPNTTHATY